MVADEEVDGTAARDDDAAAAEAENGEPADVERADSEGGAAPHPTMPKHMPPTAISRAHFPVSGRSATSFTVYLVIKRRLSGEGFFGFGTSEAAARRGLPPLPNSPSAYETFDYRNFAR